MTAVKAKELYQRDVHYIVKDEMVQIVDEVCGLYLIEPFDHNISHCLGLMSLYESNSIIDLVDMQFTGRVVENRRWADGIHQAVEAKEGVPIQVCAQAAF